MGNVMKITNVIKKMKQINPDRLVMIKIGQFFYVYGKDSYIISYALMYKIQYVENIPYTSFPKSAINKVLTKVETLDVDYIIIDKNRNYEEVESFKSKSNNYTDLFKKAQKYIKKKNKIENIHYKLIKNINSEKINEILLKVEDIVNEV